MTDIPAWGIDLTAVSLKAVKLALSSEGKVRAEAWEVIDFAEDVENVQGLGRHDAQKRALHSFLRHHNVRDCLVFASLRGESAFNRTVTVPQTGDPNLDRLLEYEAQQQIPYPLDDVFWDRRVVAIRAERRRRSRRSTPSRSRSSPSGSSRLEIAGLPVDGLVLRPVALQNFCARERLLEPGSVVIDVGYGATQVLLVHEDQTTFRCLAVGGVRAREPHREDAEGRPPRRAPPRARPDEAEARRRPARSRALQQGSRARDRDRGPAGDPRVHERPARASSRPTSCCSRRTPPCRRWPRC